MHVSDLLKEDHLGAASFKHPYEALLEVANLRRSVVWRLDVRSNLQR